VRAYLDSAGTPPQFFTDLDAEAELLGEHLRERCAAMPDPDLARLFDEVYVEQTGELREQQADFVAWRGQYEGSPA
jgi:pyruvate dehydrogenase E1 component alpha subunit